MKKLFKQFLLLGFVALTSTSCLKDKATTDYTNIQPVIIIPNANWPKNTSTAATAVTVSTTPSLSVPVYARVSWEKMLSNELVVSFAKDEADVAAYNTKFGTNYLPVPDAAITAQSLKVTIPANTRDANITVTVNTTRLDKTKTYMLPYKIIDASGQNLGVNYITYLYPFSLK
ncbi:MAG: DUF1735 domain-containing protein [Sphingobacteriaceae bacterium]|nr:MAG: DUF1735 domain-containing protein [Sphingobacteriaceae bacterium]